jgi:hypothetical protein
MNPMLLIWPMLIHGFATMVLFVPMSRTRRRLIRQGKAKAGQFRLLDAEPEESRRFSNAIRNQNETGLLYYAGLLAAFVTQSATPLLIALAWLFLALKLAHLAVHVTSNRLRYRFPLFTASLTVLALFWLVLAAHLGGLL